MKLRENSMYAIAVPTSMGVRITPLDGQPVYCGDTFKCMLPVPRLMLQAFRHTWGCA